MYLVGLLTTYKFCWMPILFTAIYLGCAHIVCRNSIICINSPSLQKYKTSVVDERVNLKTEERKKHAKFFVKRTFLTP